MGQALARVAPKKSKRPEAERRFASAVMNVIRGRIAANVSRFLADEEARQYEGRTLARLPKFRIPVDEFESALSTTHSKEGNGDENASRAEASPLARSESAESTAYYSKAAKDKLSQLDVERQQEEKTQANLNRGAVIMAVMTGLCLALFIVYHDKYNADNNVLVGASNDTSKGETLMRDPASTAFFAVGMIFLVGLCVTGVAACTHRLRIHSKAVTLKKQFQLVETVLNKISEEIADGSFAAPTTPEAIEEVILDRVLEGWSTSQQAGGLMKDVLQKQRKSLESETLTPDLV